MRLSLKTLLQTSARGLFSTEAAEALSAAVLDALVELCDEIDERKGKSGERSDEEGAEADDDDTGAAF